jgi:hypothetical protein
VGEVSLRGYAKHRGVSLRAVQKAIHSGRIAPTASGKIDIEVADGQWQRNTGPRPTSRTAAPPRVATSVARPAPEPPLKAETSGQPGLDYSRARAVRENYLARLTKIEFEERSGNLVSKQEVEVAAFNRYRTFRDNMLNIPDRLAAVLAAEVDPATIHEMLTGEIRRALQESSNGAERS